MRYGTMQLHANSRPHAVSLAWRESNAAPTTVIGGLPPRVRNAVSGLFLVVTASCSTCVTLTDSVLRSHRFL